VEIATLCEFYETDGFFTASCDPYMGHTFRKMPEVVIKLDKMIKD
jgi:hypothetical protein